MTLPVAPSERDPKLVFIGLPCAGDPLWEATRILSALELKKHESGHRFIVRKIGNQGIAKSRNLLLHMARMSGAGTCMMVDGDMPFDERHFFRILSHPEEVVGAFYPKKEVPLNFAGEFLPADQCTPDQKARGLWPCTMAGGGFLKIEMTAVDRMMKRWPELEYVSEETALPYQLVAGQKMFAFFGEQIVEDDWFGKVYRRFLTEDWLFCWRFRKAGGEIFLDQQCQVGHKGSIDFLNLHAMLEAAEEKGRADGLASFGQK